MMEIPLALGVRSAETIQPGKGGDSETPGK